MRGVGAPRATEPGFGAEPHLILLSEARERRAETVMRRAGYILARFGQLLGMWLLLVDLFTAGPLGPNPRLFAAGVVVFLVGWSMNRLTR